MISHTRSPAEDATGAFISWLATGAVGPALVALPVNLAAEKLAAAAVRWFRRFRQSDDLSRLVKAAADASDRLTRNEIKDLRRLLEKEDTWRVLATGALDEKLQELTDQIAECLPPRNDRTVKGSRAAAETVVRGLLEFAVYDLQPEVFQKVVLARLQQMTKRASALDTALFHMHKDLYHLVDEATDLFTQVMNRLPPGCADLGEIRIYLKTLIGWLNQDPWPEDPRLGGPRLNSADIERKLHVTTSGSAPVQSPDADTLAQQCSRLVILGGPGSGKTWLAKRTARICAEKALTELADSAALDEVELPLYTSCTRLVSGKGDIRLSAASSATERIGDLGGSRIVESLRLFFTERRDEPTLLVIDSLDEATDADEARERLREADSLRHPWRVVLTSRPSSWNNQLTIERGNQAHQVGELQPLRYPGDVEPVIEQWFAGQPERGNALTRQIAERPSLQQAATVPLILAFYCILGGAQPLPEFRHKLSEQVVSRMLHAPWRSSSGAPPDVGACRAALQVWAWEGANDHHISGVGQWEDDIPTEGAQLSAAGQNAVDHVAVPRDRPDFDTNEISRRFVHRSIREHLVSEHIGGHPRVNEALPARVVVKTLLPHLWYDPDWEYAAPAAIAMHPEHDKILRSLLCEASRSDEVPPDLSAVDAGGEMCKLLARVAAESREDDWSREMAAIIGQALEYLARSHKAGDLGEATHWPTSNRPARQAYPLSALYPTEEAKRQARQALLERLIGRDASGLPWPTHEVADRLARLDLTDEDKRQVRQALLSQLASESDGTDETRETRLAETLILFDPTEEHKRQARRSLLNRLLRETGTLRASYLAAGLVRMDPTDEDKREARQALLSRLVSEGDATGVTWEATTLTETLIRLDPTDEDKREARQALLNLLVVSGPETERPTGELAAALAQLDPTDEDKRQARQAVLDHLPYAGDSNDARWLVTSLALLDPTAEDKRQARHALLSLLALTGQSGAAHDLARLDPTDEDKRQAREALLEQLASRRADSGAVLALAEFSPTVDDLSDISYWRKPPFWGFDKLLAAVRRNSSLEEWLAVLPTLSSLSSRP